MRRYELTDDEWAIIEPLIPQGCRRVATRFEKLRVNFLAMIHLASIERYFRILSPNGA